MDYDTVTEIVTKTFLFCLIFGISATVKIDNMKRQIRNKVAIFMGIVTQFVVMPFVGYIAILSFRSGLTKSMGMTLLIVTSSPGGSFSNWWCSLFNADLALSVAMTTLSTILSIFFLPFNLFIYTHAAYGESEDDLKGEIQKSIDWNDLVLTLVLVIVAIMTGLITSMYSSHRFHYIANVFGTVSGLALILFTFILSTFAGDDSGSTLLWAQEWTFYVGTSFPCVLGLVIANMLTFTVKLYSAERVTIGVESCYQNTGIATSAAVSMFSDSSERAQAINVALFYGVVEIVVLSIYCIVAWKLGWTKAPPDEKLYKILITSYEVSDNDNSQCDCRSTKEQLNPNLENTHDSLAIPGAEAMVIPQDEVGTNNK